MTIPTPESQPAEPSDHQPSPVYWLHQPSKATHLDIVCLGWSAPASAIGQYHPSHAVVAIANPTDTGWVDDLITTANCYDNCRITAWSLGVVTASRLLGDITHAQWEAINGVMAPFDGGLDRATSEAMATALTPAALTAFQMGMCGSKSALRAWQALDGHPTRPHAQAALAWWIALADQPATVPVTRWHRVIVGTHDRIMPPTSQLAQWAVHPTLTPTTVTAPHWIPTYLLANEERA